MGSDFAQISTLESRSSILPTSRRQRVSNRSEILTDFKTNQFPLSPIYNRCICVASVPAAELKGFNSSRCVCVCVHESGDLEPSVENMQVFYFCRMHKCISSAQSRSRRTGCQAQKENKTSVAFKQTKRKT